MINKRSGIYQSGSAHRVATVLPADEPNAGDTFHALASLAMLGAVPDDNATRSYLQEFQRTDGSFTNVTVGHAVCRSLAILGNDRRSIPRTGSDRYCCHPVTVPARSNRPPSLGIRISSPISARSWHCHPRRQKRRSHQRGAPVSAPGHRFWSSSICDYRNGSCAFYPCSAGLSHFISRIDSIFENNAKTRRLVFSRCRG